MPRKNKIDKSKTPQGTPSDKLPKGWVKTTLGEVCLPVSTIQPGEFPELEFTYFDIGGIDNERNQVANTKIITGRTAPSRARQLVRKGDILFSTVRTYLKKIARIERDFPNPVASTGFTVLRAAEGVSPDFLFFQVLTDRFLQPLHKLQSGTSYPAVRSRDILAQPIVLAPTHEQEQIAAKLEATFSQLAAGEKAARRALERLQRYRASVLHSAASGELTRDWREAQTKDKTANTETGEALLRRILKARRDEWLGSQTYKEPASPRKGILPKPPNGWTIASLEQLTSPNRVICYGILMPKEHVIDGIPYVKVRDIQPDGINVDSLARTSPLIAAQYSRSSLRSGDILLAIRGTFGRVAEVPPELDGGNITQDTARLALSGSVNRHYVALFLRSDLAQGYFKSVARGIAVRGVNIGDVRPCPILLPQLAEQTVIVKEVERRLLAADQLASAIGEQLTRVALARESILHDAFRGAIFPQQPENESTDELIQRIQLEKERIKVESGYRKSGLKRASKAKEKAMKTDNTESASERMSAAFDRLGKEPNAARLFAEAAFAPEDVTSFYEELRANPVILDTFANASAVGRKPSRRKQSKRSKRENEKGRFRLIHLWLEDFKNLKDYVVRFGPTSGLDVVLGWNGTGKSNLFESLVVIFRDLHEWRDKGKWPKRSMKGYRLTYEIGGQIVEVEWKPLEMKRPVVKVGSIPSKAGTDPKMEEIKRVGLQLPRFVFGYYSGPTNRLAEHFLPMKQAHYVRLRDAKSDDPETLAALLEQRRFFCAETHHAKYVLLSFSYRKDAKISEFLSERLRIVGFESALFIVKEPVWKRNNDPNDFWGATGVMRRVLKRLQQFAIAPLVLQQSVKTGFRSINESHYYFFLPDRKSLEAFAAEYDDARTFFLALESTDFSELIHDVKVQVRVKATSTEKVSITFHEMSEGEQQLLMVLGLMRFTKSNQSLVLLDEPDTHLNPHWSVDYLKLLSGVMSDSEETSPEQQSSQILVTTHDPLVIASLEKEQIHLLKRDPELLNCFWEQPIESPRGMGYSGILMSEIFGFRSDLDSETLQLLDTQADLAGKEGPLTKTDRLKLKKVNREIEKLGFRSISSDPYYREFLEAMARDKETIRLVKRETQSRQDREAIKRSADEILSKLGEKHALDS